MNLHWSNILTLTLGLLALFLSWQRVERRRRGVVALILIGPICFLVYRWTVYRGQYAEAAVALGLALALAAGYWLAWGRKHPPGSSDSIKVWGQEE